LGHKVHPTGFRLGVIKGWQSRWYADDKNYKVLLAEDIAIRKMINKELANASVARIEIERVAGTQVSISVHTAKPGIVIGKSGEKVDRLRIALEKLTKKKVHPKIIEIRNPEVDAFLVGRSIAEQLEKRVSFRRAMKQAVQKAIKGGAKGIKIICSGRLGGAEIARTEREVEGSVPLHTLRADIDFGIVEAHTTFGTIGIKVWIYKGIVLAGKRQSTTPLGIESLGERQPRPERAPRGDRGGFRGGERGGGDRGGRPGGDRGGFRSGPSGGGSGGGGGFRSGPTGGGGPRPPMGDNRGPRPPFTPNNGPRPPFTPNNGPRPVGSMGPGPRPEGTGVTPPAPRPSEPASSNPAPAPEQKPEA